MKIELIQLQRQLEDQQRQIQALEQRLQDQETQWAKSYSELREWFGQLRTQIKGSAKTSADEFDQLVRDEFTKLHQALETESGNFSGSLRSVLESLRGLQRR